MRLCRGRVRRRGNTPRRDLVTQHLGEGPAQSWFWLPRALPFRWQEYTWPTTIAKRVGLTVLFQLVVARLGIVIVRLM